MNLILAFSSNNGEAQAACMASSWINQSFRQRNISDDAVKINRERGFRPIKAVPSFRHGVNPFGQTLMGNDILMQIVGEPIVSTRLPGGLQHWLADGPAINNVLNGRLIESPFSGFAPSFFALLFPSSLLS